jgi:hypothetical protein
MGSCQGLAGESADHGDSVGASQEVIMILPLNEKVTSLDGDRRLADVLPGLSSARK